MRKTYPEIHLLRILACLMVIVIHVTATPVVTLIPNSIPQLFFIFINRFSKPSVPIFIFISGFLLKTPSPSTSFYKNKIPKLVVPYILWATAYYVLFVILKIYPLSLNFYLLGLLKGTFVYHLYFMVIILQLYLLFPLIQRAYTKWGILPVFLLSLALQTASGLTAFPMQDRLFPTYIGYFVLGMVLRENKHTFSLYKGSTLILTGLLYTHQFIESQNNGITLSFQLVSLTYMLFSLYSCYVLLCLMQQAKALYHRHEQTYNFLSRSTLTVYYAHPLIIMISDYLLYQLGVISVSLHALIAFIAIPLILLPLLRWIYQVKESHIL